MDIIKTHLDFIFFLIYFLVFAGVNLRLSLFFFFKYHFLEKQVGDGGSLSQFHLATFQKSNCLQPFFLNCIQSLLTSPLFYSLHILLWQFSKLKLWIRERWVETLFLLSHTTPILMYFENSTLSHTRHI